MFSSRSGFKRIFATTIKALAFLLLSTYLYGFGKNKVNYRVYNWYTFDSNSLKIFIAEPLLPSAKLIVRVIRDALQELESRLNYSVENKISVIVFPNTIDFEQNNVVQELIGEGTLGFTEFSKGRVVVPFFPNIALFKRVVQHELVHAIQYEIMRKTSSINNNLENVYIPLWLVEGMAEYFSIQWDEETENIIRDVVLNEHLLPLKFLENPYYISGQEYYLIYKEGQAFLHFLAKNFGSEKILNIFRSYILGSKDPFKDELGIPLEQLEISWKEELKKRYFPILGNYKSPLESGLWIVSGEELKNYKRLTKISPTFVTTNLIAFITYTDLFPKLVLYDINAKKIVREVATGYIKEQFLEFHIERNRISASTNGLLAFVSMKDGIDVIYLYNIHTQKLSYLSFTNIILISYPYISKDGRYLAFVGFDGLMEDVYLYDLLEKKLTRLTRDIYSEKYPIVLSKSKKVLYVSNIFSKSITDIREQSWKIMSVNIEDPDKHYLLLQLGKNIEFISASFDERYLGFISDVDTIPNVFVLDLKGLRTFQVTRMYANAYSVDWAPDGKSILIGAVWNLNYEIFLKDFTSENLVNQISYTNNIDKSQLKEISFESTGKLSNVFSRIRPPLNIDFEETTKVKKEEKNFLAVQGSIVENVSNVNTFLQRLNMVDLNLSRYILDPSLDYIFATLAFSSDLGSLVGFVSTAFSDVLGDQHLEFMYNNLLLTPYPYSSENFLYTSNLDMYYINYKYRFDFGVRLFSLMGYFSFLESIYKPFYDLDPYSDRKNGIEIIFSFPFSIFSRVDTFIDLVQYVDYGGVVRTFSTPRIKLELVRDKVLWSSSGPMGGYRYKLQWFYSFPFFSDSLEFVSLIGDARYYLMLSYFDSIAVRGIVGLRFGKDADKMKFYIGGVDSLRGYNIFEFSGKMLFLCNLEFRTAIIRFLVGPFNIPFPTVFGSLFIDMGFVKDYGDAINLWGYDKDGYFRFYDLKVDVGMGISIVVLPTVKFKVEWATPYDGTWLPPLEKWKLNIYIAQDW